LTPRKNHPGKIRRLRILLGADAKKDRIAGWPAAYRLIRSIEESVRLDREREPISAGEIGAELRD